MEIASIRIDERLIHGQVAAMWTGSLKVNRIMVIDNEIIKNDLQKQLLKMACPANIKLSILNVETAAINLKNEKYVDDRIFIVLKGPEVLNDLWDHGFTFEKVNVGNMSSGSDTRQIKKTINITPEDERLFRELNEKGVYFFAQMTPSEEPEDFMKLI